MPTEVGELEVRVPSMAVTGLQRNVIAMAFCCKKSVGTSEGQLGMNLAPTKSHSNYIGTTVYHGPNVIRLWWLVLNSSSVARCFNIVTARSIRVRSVHMLA